MKTFYSVIYFLLMTSVILAQPTLTSSWLPDIGDKSESIAAHAQDLVPGPAGMNQTWDFSSVVQIDTVPIVTFEYFDPTISVYTDLFPTANLALAPVGLTSDSSFATFYSRGANELVTLGNAGPGFLVQYSDTRRIIETPFTFGSTTTDDFAGVRSISGGILSHTYGNELATGDATGTIHVPTGTFSNVLRVKIEANTIDSTNLSGLLTLLDLNVTSYLWFSPSIPGVPIASLVITNGTSTTQFPPLPPVTQTLGETRNFSYIGSAVVAVDELSKNQLEMNVSPNPVENNTVISWKAEEHGPVSVYVRDINGKIVNQRNIIQQYGTNKLNLSLSSFSAGIYMVELKGRKFSTHKKIIKQ